MAEVGDIVKLKETETIGRVETVTSTGYTIKWFAGPFGSGTDSDVLDTDIIVIDTRNDYA